MKMINLILLKNKNGSIIVFNLSLTMVLVFFVLGLNLIYNNVNDLLDKQNKEDAHALSVISLYVYTLNEISYTNKKLKELGFLSFIVSKVPGAESISASIKIIIKGIKKYQDFLLLKLKLQSKYIDFNLRLKNKLSLNIKDHSLKHRRQSNFFSLFDVELIEIEKEVFNTACINHSNIISSTKTCVYNEQYYSNLKTWFAPLKDNWSVKYYAK
jgi:hypothetical protein